MDHGTSVRAFSGKFAPPWQLPNKPSILRFELWLSICAPHFESPFSIQHRDLHWGQVLIDTVSKQEDDPVHMSLDDLSHGVKATIIDFGLSRMEVKRSPKTKPSVAANVQDPEGVQFTVFDETIFNGEGKFAKLPYSVSNS